MSRVDWASRSAPWPAQSSLSSFLSSPPLYLRWAPATTLPLLLPSWPSSFSCARAAFSPMPGGLYSNDTTNTIPHLHSHRGSDLRHHGPRSKRHLGLVRRLRSRLLRLFRVGCLHDARSHYRPTDLTDPVYPRVAAAIPACPALRRHLLGPPGTHRWPDRAPPSAWHLFLHPYVSSALRTLCTARSVCPPIPPVHRPVPSRQ